MQLPGDWRESDSAGPDFTSLDGRRVLEVKRRPQGGLRDLRGSLLEMATWLALQPQVKQGILVIYLPRMTMQRVQRAWEETQAALRPEVARRIAIIALTQETRWTTPPNADLEALADAVLPQIAPERLDVDAVKVSDPHASRSFFEVMKVLLEAWLRDAGPLQIQEIALRSGCSFPTVSLALARLEQRDELQRSRNRRAELRGLPRKSLEEAILLSNALRETRWIIDVSGRPGDPTRLLQRLQRSPPPNLAIGGVTAARFYQAEFDLNGTPRLDLILWAPRRQRYEPAIISDLDPGLKVVSVKQPGAVAAVHRLSRANPLFENGPRGLPYADRVEVLLDLYDLGLGAQARAFTQHLRGAAA